MKLIHLDLKVPKGWAQCSTRELEMIAEEMIRSQMMASLSRFHPFDWTEIKTRLFFRFSGVEIVTMGSDPDVLSSTVSAGSDPSVMMSPSDKDTDRDSPRSAITDSTEGTVPTVSFVCRHPSLGKETFELQTWQVHSFMEQLAWLDATDGKGRALPMPKLMWPYPTRLRRWWPLWKRDYYAPGELMDGMTWQTYRWINDWMEAYTNTANALVAEREKPRPNVGKRSRFGRICGRLITLGSGTSVTSATSQQMPDPIVTLASQERDIRQTVLSLVFGCPKWRIRLARISEVEWQVIMFWWSSMMQYLKEQYPKCFKSSDKKPRSRSKSTPLPIELYTRSMATLQKYLGGLTEDEINSQTAHAILRHLNDMAVEAEEMEKIRRKHK